MPFKEDNFKQLLRTLDRMIQTLTSSYTRPDSLKSIENWSSRLIDQQCKLFGGPCLPIITVRRYTDADSFFRGIEGQFVNNGFYWDYWSDNVLWKYYIDIHPFDDDRWSCLVTADSIGDAIVYASDWQEDCEFIVHSLKDWRQEIIAQRDNWRDQSAVEGMVPVAIPQAGGDEAMFDLENENAPRLDTATSDRIASEHPAGVVTKKELDFLLRNSGTTFQSLIKKHKTHKFEKLPTPKGTPSEYIYETVRKNIIECESRLANYLPESFSGVAKIITGDNGK